MEWLPPGIALGPKVVVGLGCPPTKSLVRSEESWGLLKLLICCLQEGLEMEDFEVQTTVCRHSGERSK